jgi:hypothetical protein
LHRDARRRIRDDGQGKTIPHDYFLVNTAPTQREEIPWSRQA